LRSTRQFAFEFHPGALVVIHSTESRKTKLVGLLSSIFHFLLRSVMPRALTEITKEAIQLSRPQRLALAGLLLELEDGGTDPQADEAWEQEIQARIKAVDDGTAIGVSYEEARLRPILSCAPVLAPKNLPSNRTRLSPLELPPSRVGQVTRPIPPARRLVC